MIDLSRENILEIYYLVEKLVEIFHDDERAHNRETINRFIADYYLLRNHMERTDN